jgi:hypothetical protein
MARTKFNYDPAEKQEEQKRNNDTGKHECEVFGCPRLATIKTNHWNCRYHNLRAGNSLDGITLTLKTHEREINWYEKVLNMPFHDYDKFKGNAPKTMIHELNEDLIKYRARMQKYISDLLANPTRKDNTVKYTYADNVIGGSDD